MTVTRMRWMILGMLFLSTVINYLDRQALSVLLPTLRSEIGVTSADYGLITTAFLLAFTLASVPFGMWIDHVGTRVGLAVAVLGWSIAAGLHALARGPLSLCVLRGALGLFEGGNFPGGAKAVASWFPPRQRAFAMALFDCGTAVGAVLAPPLVALLAMYFGWRAAFLSTSSLGLLWLLGWISIYHSPDAALRLSATDRASVLAEVGAPKPRPAVFGAALRAIVGTRQLWGLMATRLSVAPVWWFYVFWLPDYLHRDRGFSLADTGMYAWIPFLTVDMGKLAGGAFSDRLIASGHSATTSRRLVLILSATAMIGGLMVVAAGSSHAALAWVCLATFGFGAWSANILALHADVFPAETMASAMGTTLMASSLSGAAFTYAVGQSVDRVGYTPVFTVVGLLPLVALLPLFFLVGRIERVQVGPLSNPDSR